MEPQEIIDLISLEHLSILSDVNRETLHRSIMNSSKIWLGCDDTDVLAFWGLIPPSLLADEAYLWLWTTKHFDKHVFMFIRHSQRAVKEMLEAYPLIVGHGMLEHRRSLRWLRWLGAEFGDPQPPFIPFKIRAESWQQPSAQSA